MLPGGDGIATSVAASAAPQDRARHLARPVGLYDRLANNWDRLVAVFVGAGGMSYLASVTAWLEPYGPVGIGAVALISGLVLWMGLALAKGVRSKAALRRAEAMVIEKWKDQVDTFNPLHRELNTVRFRLEDLAHPFTRRIENKRLIDCDMLGPANLFLSHNCSFEDLTFMSCDLVVTRQSVRILNVIVIEDVKIIGGTIHRATIFVHPSILDEILSMGSPEFVTLTGRKEIDDRPLREE